MEQLVYNPSSHSYRGYIWEDASAFTCWAAAWDSTNLSSSDKAIVPAARMAVTERRRASDTTTSDAAKTVESAFEAEVNDSFEALRGIVPGRRVLFPTYLQDDGIGGRDLDNFNTTKNYNSKVVIAGSNWDSPYQFMETTNSQTRQARDLFKRYVSACEQNNATFNYIMDDQESWNTAWSIGSVRHTTGAVDSGWEAPGDARLIKAIVESSKFQQTTHGDLVRSLSWKSLLETAYQNIVGGSATYTTIMAPWLAVSSGSGWVTPWSTPEVYWAWQSMLRQVTETHRIHHIFQHVMNKEWFTGTYANYEALNATYDYSRYVKDMNGHRSLGGLGHTHSKYRASPVLYGSVDGLLGGGYKTTPTTTDHAYAIQPAGSGITAYSSDAYLAFIMDMQQIRATIGSNPGKTFCPWVAPATYTGASSQYPDDSRYYKEMIRHAALSGARPFFYFNATDEDTTFGDLLREIKEITKNGVLWPCTNETQDISLPSDRINLVNTASGVVTTAKICSGPLDGRYLSRITIPTTPTGGTGGTRITVLGEQSILVDIPSTSRGCWVIHGKINPSIHPTLTGI